MTSLLKLFFIRVLYGKFSYLYQSTLQDSDINFNSRKKFLRSCSRTDSLNHYLKVAEQKHEIAVFQSSSTHQFGDLQFGISFSRLRRQKPDYKCFDVEKYSERIWKRIGYKERLFNYGVKRIYHFMDNKFFFGELLFSDIRQIEHKRIAMALIKKYTGIDNDYADGDFRINFSNGFIYFENSGIHVSIKYITTSFEDVNEKLGNLSPEGNTILGSIESEPYEVL
jgi:hypothetical protein